MVRVVFFFIHHSIFLVLHFCVVAGRGGVCVLKSINKLKNVSVCEWSTVIMLYYTCGIYAMNVGRRGRKLMSDWICSDEFPRSKMSTILHSMSMWVCLLFCFLLNMQNV